ncbi:hypothetical protein ABIB40_002330 [Pedobacter sp. UYP30]|uniref:hypothetical protein n=1 Tax=Pedobacter sp. UYP30 TaxID=1756400 RepID=UPI0033916EF0
MRKYNINSLKELQNKRVGLKIDYLLLEDQLKQNGKSYLMQFSPKALFKKFTSKDNMVDVNKQFNLIGNAMSFLLPMVMRKTLFRGSGFITKAIVGLASKKIGQSLNAKKLMKLFDTAKHWVEEKIPDKLERKRIDYGIPPDSETY